MREQTYNALILGAGVSGLMCAATAAARGKRVILVDHAEKPGKKLLVTGGGKGNVTNNNMTPAHFAGENPLFTRKALGEYSTADLLAFLNSGHIPLEEREEGQIFCKHSAEDVLRLLLGACRNCDFALGEPIAEVKGPPADPLFSVHTATRSFYAERLVIATGSPAWPQLGATDFGISLARRLGHRIAQPRPALVGLTMPSDWPLGGLAGISCRVSVSFVDDGTLTLAKNAGAKGTPAQVFLKNSLPSQGVTAQNLSLLFTHKGISGPAALQTSLYWQPGLALQINFLPQVSLETLLDAPESGKLTPINIVKKLLPDRLCEALAPPASLRKKIAELSRAERRAIADAFHSHIVTPTGTEGFRKAEVAVGGVSTEDINPATLESKRIPQLYFCGEVLDITGRLGGYNLHWAFASGRLAGMQV